MVIWNNSATEKPNDIYVVKVGPRMRFCHANHLLHSAVIAMDNEQDIDDVPELTPVTTEPEVTDLTAIHS